MCDFEGVFQGINCTQAHACARRLCVHAGTSLYKGKVFGDKSLCACLYTCVIVETYAEDLMWVQCLPSPSSISVAYCCLVPQLPGLP